MGINVVDLRAAVSQYGECLVNERGNICIAAGDTAPVDNTAGYEVGCFFLDTNAADGSQWLRNDGTALLCDFNQPLGGIDLAGLTSSVAELNILDGVLATAAEINAAADVTTRIINIADAATYTALVINSGKVHVFPNLTATCTVALPAASAGLEYTFIAKAVAADAQDWRFQVAEAGVSFLGGLAFADTDAGAGADEIHAGVFPNGSSNDFMTIVTPGAGTRIYVISDGTNWIVNGQVFSATVPAFADT